MTTLEGATNQQIAVKEIEIDLSGEEDNLPDPYSNTPAENANGSNQRPSVMNSESPEKMNNL